jgi:hypothetical protein
MTQPENTPPPHIVTQHFDDPIGSVMQIDGACYVKVSNMSHTITHPVSADQSSLYYTNPDDCDSERILNGKMLCPPANALFNQVGEASANVVMTFDIPSQSVHPTSMLYNPGGVASVMRTLVRAQFPTTDTYLLPSEPVDHSGQPRVKGSVGRVIASVVIKPVEDPPASADTINKILHL